MRGEDSVLGWKSTSECKREHTVEVTRDSLVQNTLEVRVARGGNPSLLAILLVRFESLQRRVRGDDAKGM